MIISTVTASLVVLFVAWARRERRKYQKWKAAALHCKSTVSVIIPALNEAKALTSTLQWLDQLQPPAHEVIVVDGDSSDSTVETAKASGATVVIAERGRAKQMNAGAKASTGHVMCFVHADSRPPLSLVHIARRTLADPQTVLGGFRTLIEASTGGLLWFMTLHHLVKSYYLVMLARPLMFLRGGVCLFGDQTMFCRKSDFVAVDGFDASLPIMEDVDLCIRMHEAGPSANKGNRGGQCGRIRQIWSPPAITSGRRLEALGNWRATRIHFTIGLGWYLGVSREKLFQMYRTLYSDNYR